MLLLHLTQLVCPPCHSFLHVLSQATHFPGRGCTSGSAWTGQSSQQGSGAGKFDMQRSILPHSLLGPSAPHLCKWYRVCGRDGGGLQLRDGLSGFLVEFLGPSIVLLCISEQLQHPTCSTLWGVLISFWQNTLLSSGDSRETDTVPNRKPVSNIS